MANNLVNGDTFEFVSGATKADFDALKMSASQTVAVLPLLTESWHEYLIGTYPDNKIFISADLETQISLSEFSQLRFECDFAGLASTTSGTILYATIGDENTTIACYPVIRTSTSQATRNFGICVFEMPIYSGGVKDSIGNSYGGFTSQGTYTFTNGSVVPISKITKVGICLIDMNSDAKYLGGVTVKITPIK